MLELLIAGAAGVYGHLRSRKFVGRRLRYTTIVEKPALGLWTGVGATILAAPLAWLPFVGIGTAIAIGAGILIVLVIAFICLVGYGAQQ